MKIQLKIILTIIVMSMLGFWLVCFLAGCSTKHLKYSSVDKDGKPYAVEVDISYLLVNQKTNGFSAKIPEGLEIKFASQGSQEKAMEFLTEAMKAFNDMPK